MKELNELVELAKEYDSATTAEEALAVNNQFKAIATRQTILAIAEAFRELLQRAEAAEAALEHESDIHIDTAASMREWRLRAEEAEALNNHLELAARKAEGVSESLRRRAEDAENKLLFTRSAPAADLAELVPPKAAQHSDPRNRGEFYHEIECQAWDKCREQIISNIKDWK